ncbi:MAG: mlhB, partial [Solirubrobacterales bacterium]|nr:mlhB [Solirubrobacterales bacterium]
GGSAGGGLALATHRALLDRGADGPSGLLLTAPWVDLVLAAPELAASEKADGFLRRSWLGWAARLYAAGTPLDDPRLSPIHASFAGFAPAAHLDVGTHDLFLPDVRRLRDKLAAAGVDVTYVEQPGGRHTYPLFLERPEAQATVAAQARWLRRVETLQRVDERQG